MSDSAYAKCRVFYLVIGVCLFSCPNLHAGPHETAGIALIGQWTGPQSDVLKNFQSDIQYAREGILGQVEVSSPWVASSTVLLRWIGYKEYVDLAEDIQETYQLLDPTNLQSDLEGRSEVLSQQEDDWVGWIDAALMARALSQPSLAVEYLGNAMECPSCVDSPGLRVLRAKSFLESSNIPAAHLEYETAIAMASATNNPAFLFRIRQMYTDDLYDRGYLDQAIENAYICMDSEYPMEKAWAYAMEIVYLWSRDNLEGVQNSVNELTSLLPQVAPQEDSRWEPKRFGQIQFLHSTAQNALQGDQLSKMILDVEAIDFHYKKGEFQKALDRLSPWVAAYPTASQDSFSEEEKDWSLWAKYNYLTLTASLGEEVVAEEGFREIVETVAYQDNPSHVVMAWCGLAQALNLQDKSAEANTALQMGLDLDANDIAVIPESVENEREQPRILGGKMSSDARATYVQAYRQISDSLNSQGGEN